MTTQEMISQLNASLVNEQPDITVLDYVKLLNENIFNIDISFIDDFIGSVDKEGFIINHEMLFKYEILLKTSSTNVLNSLSSYEFVDGVDYQLSRQLIDDGRTEKNIYMLNTDAFKMICIRSKNTKKYARYYLLLEKCIKYYNDFEKLKLEHKINEINKIKLLKLDNGQTLDNYMIIKCDEDTLHIRKYKGVEYVYKHNYVKFPYATVKGSDKNVSKTLKINKLKIENVIFNKQLPSQNNFNKKINEALNKHIVREKVFYSKTNNKVYFGDIEITDEDENDEDFENITYNVSLTRFFKLIDMSENKFIEKVNIIDLSRFNL